MYVCVQRVCMCVCVRVCVGEGGTEPQMRVFDVFISSAKMFISRTERIRLQYQKCLAPAQNVLVASDKHVRLQCDSNLEVSSTRYFVVCNERVCLQCEIMFGGEWHRLSRH